MDIGVKYQSDNNIYVPSNKIMRKDPTAKSIVLILREYRFNKRYEKFYVDDKLPLFIEKNSLDKELQDLYSSTIEVCYITIPELIIYSLLYDLIIGDIDGIVWNQSICYIIKLNNKKHIIDSTFYNHKIDEDIKEITKMKEIYNYLYIDNTHNRYIDDLRFGALYEYKKEILC